MKIREVKYNGDYRLVVEFDDGFAVETDFRDYIFNSHQPMTSQFKDKKLFARVTVCHGILDWFGEMDFDPTDIYYNRIPRIIVNQIHAAG